MADATHTQMRIGYLVQQHMNLRRSPFDGPANHVRHVIQELHRRGHTVRLLARLDGQIYLSDDLVTFTPVAVPALDRGPLRLLERITRRVQRQFRLPYIGFFESLRFAGACSKTLSGYDLLLERRSWMTYGGAIAARWLKIPLVLEDNGDPLLDLEAKGKQLRGLQLRLSLAVMRWAMHSASHIVASGDGWREVCIRRWGLPPGNVTTVENGTTLLDHLPRPQTRAFQSRRDDRPPCTLVYVGGFYPWHGIPNLLRAVARAVQQATDVRLILIGAGSGMPEAQALVAQLNLRERVTFTGHLAPAEYAPLLANCDIGVSPYCNWPEFSGLKVLDYKAAGLAIIASGRDGAPATLRHGETGWIVPPCDHDALTNAIVHLAGDEELRQRLGRAARIEAEQQHGWQHTVAKLEQLFTRLLPARPTAPRLQNVVE